MNYKTCSKCKKPFPATSEFFGAEKQHKDGFNSWCRLCRNKQSREYRRNNLEYREKENQRRSDHYKNDPEYREKIDRQSREWKKNNPDKFLFQCTRNRARRAQLEFDLTLNWFQERFNKGTCEATGFKFISNTDKKHARNPFIPSVDRIDSTKGYTMDNCQLVIWAYNVGKQNWDKKTLYKVWKGFIKQYEQERNEK